MLNNYPYGVQEYEMDYMITFRCDCQCEKDEDGNIIDGEPHEWEARAYRELGGAFLYDDNDSYCPYCGNVGTEVD